MPDASVLKVSGSDSATTVASELSRRLREGASVHVEAPGPHAVDRAVKSITICRSFVEQQYVAMRIVPAFVSWTAGDEPRAAMRLTVSLRDEAGSSAQTSLTHASSQNGSSGPPTKDGGPPQRSGRPWYRRCWVFLSLALVLLALVVLTMPLWFFVPLPLRR